MLISNFSIDNDAQSFETPRKNNYSVTAPGAHILLGYYDYQAFETPRINNHSATAPSTQFLLGDENTQSFEPHPPPPNN